jgi:hypothetical protein
MRNFLKVLLLIILSESLLNGCSSTDCSFPVRNGKTLRVKTVKELDLAVLNATPYETILIEDGIYHLSRPLLVENKAHLTICGASADSAKVILQGDGWRDFYHGSQDENSPCDIIVIRNSEDIYIADLTITEASHYGIKLDTESEVSTPNLNNINIYRCHFLNNATRSLKGTAPQDHRHLAGGSVSFCIFENSKIPDTSWLYNGDYIAAIDMMYLKNWEFSDNMFKNIKGANGGGRGAIFIWNQSRSIIIERNLFIGCDRSIAMGNPSEPTYYEPGTLHNYDGIIRNNFIVSGHNLGKGIELVWADNIGIYHNTIYAPDPEYLAIHYFQKISSLSIVNNLVRGKISGEGEKVSLKGNIAGYLQKYLVNPEVGNLHLTKNAEEALGNGVQLLSVTDDIDHQKRNKHPDVGADQKSIWHFRKK